MLLITSDQLRTDFLSPLPPNLTHLSSQGITFTNHFTVSAPCGPSRASLLTSRYPFSHRATRNGTPLAHHITRTSLPMLARSAGVDETVLFGYTDVTMDPARLCGGRDVRGRTFEGVLEGFDVRAMHNEGELEGWVAWIADRRGGVEGLAADMSMYLHRGTRAGQVLEAFSREPARYAREESDTAFLCEAFKSWVRFSKPSWLAHLSLLRPHPPFIAPAPFNAMFAHADVPRPVRSAEGVRGDAAVHPFIEALLAEQDNAECTESQVNAQRLDDAGVMDMRCVYKGLIAEVDHNLGSVFASLGSDLSNTMIIFTSDHGEMLGDHRLFGKGGVHDPAYRIPLIVVDPRVPAAKRGSRCEAFTESVDVLPTILSFLGEEAPVELEGRDLAPLLASPEQPPEKWRDGVFWEFDFRRLGPYRGIPPDQCVLNVWRDARWKYVHFASDRFPPLLFDLLHDPHETTNVAQGNEAVVLRMMAKILNHRIIHADRSLVNTRATGSGVKEWKGGRY